MPSYNNHEVTEPKISLWVADYLETNHRLPSTFEVNEEVKKWAESKNAKWDAKINMAYDCSEDLALQWMLGESMDESFKYRNPDPPPPFDDNCIYLTTRGNMCVICQNAEEGDKVGLKSCGCIYHEKCIRQAYKFSVKCPVCNCNINEYTEDEADSDIVVEVFV